jgi:hypothetical protein
MSDRQKYAIEVFDKGLNRPLSVDFFPSVLEAEILVIIYRIKYTEKVAMQLVKQHADFWHSVRDLPFHFPLDDTEPTK